MPNDKNYDQYTRDVEDSIMRQFEENQAKMTAFTIWVNDPANRSFMALVRDGHGPANRAYDTITKQFMMNSNGS